MAALQRTGPECRPQAHIHTRPPLEDLATEADSLIAHSLATNTWKAYKTAADSLLRFRREYGFPDSWPVPLDQLINFEIYCNDKTESYHITEKNLKVSINTITWLRTKFLIIHTVTLRGIVNVENIYMLYCDLFSCDLLFCDFYFRLPFMYCRYIISHSLDEMYEHQISILLKFHVLP